MITWDNFYLFALPAIVLWGAGAVFALFSKERSRWAIGLTLSVRSTPLTIRRI